MGYQARKKLIGKVIDQTDKGMFLKTCEEYYDFSYDRELARFDPLDMSDKIESTILCESLYDLREALRPHKMAELPDVLRYSYILSIQSFIEAYEVWDYGRCEEYDARQLVSFCFDFFDWPNVFSLWRQDLEVD